MAWSKHPTAPAWGGKYEILNLIHNAQREYYRDGTIKWFGMGGMGCMGLVLLMLASALGSFGGPIGIMGALVVAGAGWAWFYADKEAKKEIWQGDFWTFAIVGERAEYRRAGGAIPPMTARPDWVVPLDAVASVETAPTRQFTGVRDYGGRGNEGDLRAIPDGEWQVFLFLNDGTRHPVYFANGARDACNELATSIRAEIDGRAAARPPAPDGSRPSAFDL